MQSSVPSDLLKSDVFKMMAQLSAPPSLSFRPLVKIHCPNCNADLNRLRHICLEEYPALQKIIDGFFDGTLVTAKIATGIKHRYSKIRISYPDFPARPVFKQDVFDDKQEIKGNRTPLDYTCIAGKCENEACRVYNDEERKLAAFKQCQPQQYADAMELKAKRESGIVDLSSLCWECENGFSHKCQCGQRADLHTIQVAKAKLRREQYAKGEIPIPHKTPWAELPLSSRHEIAICQSGGRKPRRRRLPRKKTHLPKNMATAIEVRCRSEPPDNKPRPHMSKWVRILVNLVAGATSYVLNPSAIAVQDQNDYVTSGIRWSALRLLRARVYPSVNADTTAPFVVTDLTVQVYGLTGTTTSAGASPQLNLVTTTRGSPLGHFSRALSWVWSKVDQAVILPTSAGTKLALILTDSNYTGGEIIIDVEVVFVD